MSLTATQILHFKALMVAWYHATRRPVPKGFAPHSPTVGVVFRRMIVTYQTAHHLKVNGTLATETQKGLNPPDPVDVQRSRVVAYCQWAVEHRNRFVYSQDRPIHRPSPPDLYTLPIATGRYRDCSAFAKDAAHAGGFPDPSGFSFESGYGNTDSMYSHARAHGKLLPLASLKQGDLILFESPGHVVVVTGPHPTNPAGARWVASDGHQGAPEIVSLADEERSHSGYVQGVGIA
jgi:hypothetical protein